MTYRKPLTKTLHGQ